MSLASPIAQVKALFLAYFALVGSYSPYLALYFASWGLSIAQISVLVAVPQVMRVVAPTFWGVRTDRSRRISMLLVISALGMFSVCVLMPLVQGQFFALLLLVASLHFFSAAQTPIGESMALAAAQGDPGAYGRMRLWGSIGFILSVLLVGPVLDVLGVRWLFLPVVSLGLFLVLVAWRIDARRPPDRQGSGEGTLRGRAPVWNRLREPRIAMLMLSCALMQHAHAALYAFYGLFLDGHGYSKSAIGMAWSIGVLAEIAMFRGQQRLFARFDALSLLGMSMAVAALRFLLVAGIGELWLGIFVTQLMHAITFGVHHSAVMALLHRWFDAGSQGRAQALYATIGYGVGGAVGGLSAGWFWSGSGPQAAFVASSVVAGLGCLAVLACRHFDRATAKA